MDRIKYQYQIIRYMPDRVKEEFVNVGVIVYSSKDKFIRAEVIDKYRRITQFFGEVNGQYLISTLKSIKSELDSIKFVCEQINASFPDSLDSLTKRVLPKDDSALYMTQVQQGLDISLDKAVHSLTEKYLQHNEETPVTMSDKDVWTRIYKSYFEKHGIAKKLKRKIIKTQSLEIKFDLAYKNGVWNCLEAVNFDLKYDESITDKLFRYLGKFDTLGSSDEILKYHILANLKSGDSKINDYIIMHLNNRVLGNATINLVTEEDADSFVESIKESMH